MTKMRILKVWFYDIFNELGKKGEINFKHPYMGQEGIGGPHRERGTVLAILLKSNLIEIDMEAKPKLIRTKGVTIKNKSNEEVWALLKRRLPSGSLIVTPTRKKRNIVYEWDSDQVIYVSEGNYLKKDKKE